MNNWKSVKREIYIQTHSKHYHRDNWEKSNEKMSLREFKEKFKGKVIHDVDTLCETFDWIAEITPKTNYWIKIPIREVRPGY